MIFTTLKPSLPLEPYIRDYLLAHFRFEKSDLVPPKLYPVLPEQGFTFYIKGFVIAETPDIEYLEKRPRSVIWGQPLYHQFYNINGEHQYLMVNVTFHSGSLFRMFGIPMKEFSHKNIDAEAVLGKQMIDTNNKLSEEKSYQGIIQVINQFFENALKDRRSKRNSRMDLISSHIEAQPDLFSLDKVSDLACYSPSQFERKFIQEVGISPKFFARICRFRKATHLREKFPKKDWLSIAIDSGYYDYQHLAKDFKRFSGETPISMLNNFNASPERWFNLV